MSHGDERMRLVLLKELPLEVVRVAERDHGEFAGPIQLDSIRVGPNATQHNLQLLERLASTAYPDSDVIEADPALIETVAFRSPWQMRAENESRARVADAVAKVPQVGEVLVEYELRQRRVEAT